MRYCAEPHCNVLVHKGRCPIHTKQADKARGTSYQRGYDSAWATYSTQFRQAHPVCGERADGSMDSVHSRCVQQGLTTQSECVDHIIPMSQGGDKWDESNHLALCIPCNSWKANTIERAS